MATNSTASTESDATEATAVPDADAVFEQVIWSDPEICNGCFARFRSITEFRHELRHPATEATEYDYATEEHGGSTPLREHSRRSTCDACGAVGGVAAAAVLSRREALQRVPTLVKRLEEAGYDVDGQAIREQIRDDKTTSDRQGRDREMFARAVAAGLRATD